MSNFGCFVPESINFLILTKFPLYYFSKVMISNLTFFFPKQTTNVQILAFWAKKHNLSNLLTKLNMLAVSKVLFSNLIFSFQSYGPKCPILGILGQKVLTF